MKHTKKHSILPVILSAVFLGLSAVVFLYGSATGGLFSEDPAAIEDTAATEDISAAPFTGPASSAEDDTEAAAEPPSAEDATEPATEANTDYLLDPEPITQPPPPPPTMPSSSAVEEFAELPEEGEPSPTGLSPLALVNAANPLPGEYEPPLAEAEDGFLFDAGAVGALLDMLAGARAEGLSPMLCSAYRSFTQQLALYEDKVDELILAGYARPDAEAAARTIIAYPGTSEHNLGLAADIVADYYDVLDRTQAGTPEVIWLTAHCQDYGFILRYPENKESLTGVMYEPWHFRYVGAEAAGEIMGRGICLEEYLANE